MKNIKKLKDIEEVKFSVKSLEKEGDEKPTIKTSVEDQDKLDKEFKKELEKIQKFESFVEDDEFESESEEGWGCGCCDNCSGTENCECGCVNCKCQPNENIKKVSQFINTTISENLKYHLDNNKPITENIFRPGSDAFYGVLKEARELFDLGKVNLCDIDRELYESTDIGKFVYFNGELVPLDLPMENIIELNEAEYKGKKVKLNYPMRSSGPKKYKVYVKNPKTGKVKLLHFGDVKGGLTAKVSDPKARKAFSDRHQCHLKKDKTKAGYFACRLTKYGHLFGGKTYPGYW
jgi:hypothetical protein